MSDISHEVKHTVRFGEKGFTVEQKIAGGSIEVVFSGFYVPVHQGDEIALVCSPQEASVLADVLQGLADS